MEPATIASLAANFGFPIAMVIWFVFNNRQKAKEDLKQEEQRNREALTREDRLAKRIDTLEDTHRDELVDVIKNQTRVQTEATLEGRRQNRNLEKLISLMEMQPCLAVALEPKQGTLPRPSDRTGETTRTHSISRKD